MAKYKVGIFLNDIPFDAEAADIYEVMERLDACCKLLKNPFTIAERCDIYQRLTDMEHNEKASSLSIAGRPLSVAYNPSPVGFLLGNGPCGFKG